MSAKTRYFFLLPLTKVESGQDYSVLVVGEQVGTLLG